MTSTHTHTQTQTHSNLNYGCKLGEGGDAGGGWRQLKWKSRTDQYCWRFSSLHSPLNCHAPSKQLKALCLSLSIYPLSFFLSFFSCLHVSPCHFFLSHFPSVSFSVLHHHTFTPFFKRTYLVVKALYIVLCHIYILCLSRLKIKA